jgi:hypothetical protein
MGGDDPAKDIGVEVDRRSGMLRTPPAHRPIGIGPERSRSNPFRP